MSQLYVDAGRTLWSVLSHKEGLKTAALADGVVGKVRDRGASAIPTPC